MHAATAPNSHRPVMTLAQRIAFPSPSAAQARADLRRHNQIRRARSEMRKRQERLAALLASKSERQQLTEIAEQAAPIMIDEAAWPTDFSELSGKMDREACGDLRPFEEPVRDRDRQMLKKGLPPGIEAEMDDPFPFPWKSLR